VFVSSGVSYTEEEARRAIAASLSFAEALRHLGLRTSGGNWRTLRRYASEIWHIPTDHFDPRAGQKAALARHRRRATTPLASILVEQSTYSRGSLKRRLYAEGLKTRACELCGQGEEWNGARMALILDHINGLATDNRLENLRIVCPNCAATLETHCGRNLALDRRCETCGREYRAGHVRQRFCSHACGSRGDAATRAGIAQRTVERPPYEQLKAEIEALGSSAVGRRYGVSDSAIRKWMRRYEREALSDPEAGRSSP
jgi:hypothetical protein